MSVDPAGKHAAAETQSPDRAEAEVVVNSPDGLHMRPALQFVDMASGFACGIRVSSGETGADAKSIMQMLILAAKHGTKLKITAEGSDARQAVVALKKLIEEDLFNKRPVGPDSVREG